MPRSRIPSPARSQSATLTPRRQKSRRTRSVSSPSQSDNSVKLTAIISNSFVTSPLPKRRSVLTDDTAVETPRRKSWWKKLDENFDVMELLENKAIPGCNNVEEFMDVEILSQEKQNFTLDLPESSDGESINSIVIPQRKLFNRRENLPQKNYEQIFDNRETLSKLQKSNVHEQDIEVRPKSLFSLKPHNKPAFPAALLNISTNKTIISKPKDKEKVDEATGQVRNLFGNRPGTKRKNIFTNFILSDSEDEIPEIQPRVFGFKKNEEQKHQDGKASQQTLHSPTSSFTDIEDWKLLPSSTMLGNQLEEVTTTPNKRARLSKLSEAKESGATESNTNISKNKAKKLSNSIAKNKTELQLNSSIIKIKDIVRNNSEVARRVPNESLKVDSLTKNKSSNEKSFKAFENINESEKEDSIVKYNVFDSNRNNSKEQILEHQENNALDKQARLSKLSEAKGSEVNTNMSRNKTKTLSNSIAKSKTDVLLNSSDSQMTDKVSNNSKVVGGNSNESRKEASMAQHKSLKEISLKSIGNIDENEKEECILSKNMLDSNRHNFEEQLLEQQDNNIVSNDLAHSDQNNDNDALNAIEDEDFTLEYENDDDDNLDCNNDEKNDDNDLVLSNINRRPNQSLKDEIGAHESLPSVNSDFQKSDKDQIVTTQSKLVPENERENNDQDKDTEENINSKPEVGSTKENDRSEVEADGDGIAENGECKSEIKPSISESEGNVMSEAEVEQDVNDTEESEKSDTEAEPAVNDTEEVESEAESNVYITDENENSEADVEKEFDDTEEHVEIEAEAESEVDDTNKNDEIEAGGSPEVEDNKENDISEGEVESENRDNEESEAEDESEVEDTEENNECESVNQNVESERDENQEDMSEESEVEESDDPIVSYEANEQNERENQETLAKSASKPFANVVVDETRLKSPEAIRNNKISQVESFRIEGRNTSIRKTKSMIQNPSFKPSLAPIRTSAEFSDGTRDSSAEGSGWDSHRTTRKTLRQTFGKDFTLRKSLRALVMEKSAKRQTDFNRDFMDENPPPANSTEFPAYETFQENEPVRVDETVEAEESNHDVSKTTRQATLEILLENLKKKNTEKRMKMEEEVRNSLRAPPRDLTNLFKVPLKPVRRSKPVQKKPSVKANPIIPLDMLPAEFIEDMKYKPPKRFQPKNASWTTKRLYKFLENKLEPKYDYKARVRAEKLVETIYMFTKEIRRHEIASAESVEVLKHEMARLDIVKTHFDFYAFFTEFMPREIRIKVIPDLVNKIPKPRHGIFSDILR